MLLARVTSEDPNTSHCSSGFGLTDWCAAEAQIRYTHKDGSVIQRFYDELSPFYHLIFQDWDESIEKQAKILDKLIRKEWVKTHTVLDVSCGIGTQALGLAKRGYHVTASDLSAKEVERASD